MVLGERALLLNLLKSAIPSAGSAVPAWDSRTMKGERSVHTPIPTGRSEALRLAAAEMVRRSRSEQGLPPTVIDRSALRQIAGLLGLGTNRDEGQSRPSSMVSTSDEGTRPQAANSAIDAPDHIKRCSAEAVAAPNIRADNAANGDGGHRFPALDVEYVPASKASCSCALADMGADTPARR